MSVGVGDREETGQTDAEVKAGKMLNEHGVERRKKARRNAKDRILNKKRN